jgi:hypothetical protein
MANVAFAYQFEQAVRFIQSPERANAATAAGPRWVIVAEAGGILYPQDFWQKRYEERTAMERSRRTCSR